MRRERAFTKTLKRYRPAPSLISEGVVLSVDDIGESDRMVLLITKDFGKLKTLAKGVRASNRRFEGRLDLYTHLKISFRRYHNLDFMESATFINPFLSIRSKPTKLGMASYLSELLDLLTPLSEPNLELFDLLLSSFHEIEEGSGRRDIILRLFELRLLRLSGFQPLLDRCARCGKGIENDGEIRFAPLAGGVVCIKCITPHDQNFYLSKGALLFMRRALTPPFHPSSRLTASKELSKNIEDFLIPYIVRVAGRRPVTLRYLKWAGILNP